MNSKKRLKTRYRSLESKMSSKPFKLKPAPLPPLSQVEELYAQHSINSSIGMKSFDKDEDPLIAENKKFEEKIAQLTKENQRITAENQQILIQNDSLTKKNKKLEAKIKELDMKAHTLIEKNEQMNKEMLNLNMKLSKVPSNAGQTQKENESLKKQIEELRLELKRKESYISESRLCLQSKQNQIHETSREKLNITDKFKNLRAQNKDLELKLNQMKAEIDQYKINERNHETVLNNIKNDKDKIISDLLTRLEQYSNDRDQSHQTIIQYSNQIESLNDQLTKYQDMIKKGLNGIDESSQNIEERNWRRKEKKERANQLFEEFKKMKLQEKELNDKLSDIQSEILIEENAAKLESTIDAPKSLKQKNENNSEEKVSQNEESESKKENSENQENSENDSQSTLNKLKQNCIEAQKDLSDFLEKEEKLKYKMTKFGIKPSSFEKVDEPWTEEEDESDFTFTEIRNRIKKLRSSRNDALNQYNILKEENDSLKNDLVDKNVRIEKITEVVKSMISQRIIKPK